MQKIRWFFLVLAITFFLVLIFWNQAPTEFFLPGLRYELPLSMLLLAAAAIGFLCGALVTALMLRRRKKRHDAVAEPTVTNPPPVEPAEASAS